MSVGQQVAIIGVLAGSGARLASGALSPGDFVAFMMYMFQLVSPLTLIATGIGRLQSGLAARGRIQGVLDQPAEPAGPTDVPDVPDAAAPVLRVEGLAGGYGSGPALHEVSLTVPRRGLTALVGPSGGGKSTLLAMIERLLLPDGGTLTLHGADLSRWPLHELRRRLSYVDQSFTLLEGTVRDNLTLGLDAATPPGDAALLAALAQVDMDGVVTALPEGLDTPLGGVVDLSGGQRQRLALARALLSEADLVLLDEPSSQLDGVNEQMLRAAVDRLAADRAVLVVAHRLSTVLHAEQIVYLDGGRTLGCGPHEVLWADCPEYRRLVRGQEGAPPPRVPA
jgi:ATP-binding cassette subfamily B protein